MGTRSLIRFKEGDEVLVTIYQQYDGYPSSVGLELAKFLNRITIINGIGMKASQGRKANGMGCLAAQFIRKIKTRVGGTYISSNSPQNVEEYNYLVTEDTVEVWDEDSLLFKGTWKEFKGFCTLYQV